MSDAYIVGVDMIKFGRFPEKTVPQLGAEAALLAMDDCGLRIQDMQALYCGNLGQASGMVAGDWPNRYPCRQCVERLRDGCYGISRSLGFGQGGSL